MAKPRVFVSSTYYDLKHIRASIETFINSLGYESILFESGDIPFHHDKSLDHSCYDSVDNSHIFVLIIGGRYGSAASTNKNIENEATEADSNVPDKAYEFYNSITMEEYKRARQQDVPIYIFVEKGVAAEYLTYKENRTTPNIKYAHVDNIGVFRLLDSINSESRNNLIREFERFEHITGWLKAQWAGLFADHLTKKKSDAVLKALTAQVQTLNQVVDALKTYSEAIVRKVEPDEEKSNVIIAEVERKLLQDIIDKNPLINFINNDLVAKKESKLTVDSIISAIISNSTFSGFLNALPIDSETLEMTLGFEDVATEDFQDLQRILYEINSIHSRFTYNPATGNSLVRKSESPIKKKVTRRRDGE